MCSLWDAAGVRRERRTAEGAAGQEERGHSRAIAGDTGGDRCGAAQGCQAGEEVTGAWVCPGLGCSQGARKGSSISG